MTQMDLDQLPDHTVDYAFDTASPMWNRQGGLGLFTPQRDGPAIEIDVDRAGNMTAITDALGNQAVYGYDQMGNVISVTDPNGDATEFAYDSGGRLTQVVDALHNETDFTYAEDGLLAEETIVVDGETLTRSYDHDEAGNVVREVDRNGRVTVFAYDEAGRMTEEIWYDNEADADANLNPENTITWTYDEEGNLTSVVDNSSAYAYTYDSEGRVTSETVAAAGAPVTVLTVGYGTREDDLPVSLAATVNGTADFLTTYEYDALDRVVGIRQTDQGGNEVADKYVTLAYADNGALETIVRYESLDTSEMVVVSQYTYDDFGRLVALDHFQNPDDPLAEYTWTYEGGGLAEVSSGVNPLPDHVWTFDAAFTGLMTQMTSPDGVADYSYDARGQLTGAGYDYQDGEAYSYDSNGNRTGGGYVVGDHNRLLSDGTYNYQYDGEGNRIQRTSIATGEVTEYVWDHRNRLVAVVDRLSEDGPVVQSVEYVYDSQNRWIAKSLDSDGDGPQEATGTHFVYQGNQIVLQIDGEGQITNRYLWGPAVDQILADEQVQPDGSSGVLWTLTDHLNTVRDLAAYNPETEVTSVVNHVVYDAFGRVTSQTDPSVTTLFGFTARPFDSNTGLQNNLNRWYDAETGTWISVDPMGFAAADANLYRYVGNGVTMRVDPTGLDWRTWAAGTAGFFAGIGQGALNTVNGCQDIVIGVANLPAAGANGIAWVEEKAGILDPNDKIRVPYIPSPDWSRGAVTHEGGEGWGDTHNWSKFAGGTGVTAGASAYARAAQLARAEKARESARAANAALNEFVDEYGARGIRETGSFPKPGEYSPQPKPPSGYDGWLRPEDQFPGVN